MPTSVAEARQLILHDLKGTLGLDHCNGALHCFWRLPPSVRSSHSVNRWRVPLTKVLWAHAPHAQLGMRPMSGRSLQPSSDAGIAVL